MNANMRRMCLCAGLVSAIVSGASVAADDGRYRMMLVQEGTVLENGNTQMPRVMVLDTRDGHLWTWGMDLERRDDKPVKTRTLTYEGRLVPGKTVGEVIGAGQ